MSFKALAGLGLFAVLAWLLPDQVWAVGAFESKMGNLQNALIGKVLPLASTVGLAYAAILSVFGNGEGKMKIISILGMSVVGLLAKHIIDFLETIV